MGEIGMLMLAMIVFVDLPMFIASHVFRGLLDDVHAENVDRGLARHGLKNAASAQ